MKVGLVTPCKVPDTFISENIKDMVASQHQYAYCPIIIMCFIYFFHSRKHNSMFIYSFDTSWSINESNIDPKYVPFKSL